MNVLAICQKVKILWHFLSWQIWGWKFQNATPPTVFIRAKHYDQYGTIREYKVINV